MLRSMKLDRLPAGDEGASAAKDASCSRSRRLLWTALDPGLTPAPGVKPLGAGVTGTTRRLLNLGLLLGGFSTALAAALADSALPTALTFVEVALHAQIIR